MGAEADDLPVLATEVEAEMHVRLANLNFDQPSCRARPPTLVMHDPCANEARLLVARGAWCCQGG